MYQEIATACGLAMTRLLRSARRFRPLNNHLPHHQQERADTTSLCQLLFITLGIPGETQNVVHRNIVKEVFKLPAFVGIDVDIGPFSVGKRAGAMRASPPTIGSLRIVTVMLIKRDNDKHGLF